LSKKHKDFAPLFVYAAGLRTQETNLRHRRSVMDLFAGDGSFGEVGERDSERARDKARLHLWIRRERAADLAA
jgi:hypothetical protein